jgi:hypothetical protein
MITALKELCGGECDLQEIRDRVDRVFSPLIRYQIAAAIPSCRLIESRVDDLRRKYSTGDRGRDDPARKPNSLGEITTVPEVVFNRFLHNYDPSDNKKYLEWLCKEYLRVLHAMDRSDAPVDSIERDYGLYTDHWKDVIAVFHHLSSQGRLPSNDINSYRSIAEIEHAIENVEPSKAEMRRDAAKTGAKVVYQDATATVTKIMTWEAAVVHGRHPSGAGRRSLKSNWCIAYPSTRQYWDEIVGRENDLGYGVADVYFVTVHRDIQLKPISSDYKVPLDPDEDEEIGNYVEFLALDPHRGSGMPRVYVGNATVRSMILSIPAGSKFAVIVNPGDAYGGGVWDDEDNHLEIAMVHKDRWDPNKILYKYQDMPIYIADQVALASGINLAQYIGIKYDFPTTVESGKGKMECITEAKDPARMPKVVGDIDYKLIGDDITTDDGEHMGLSEADLARLSSMGDSITDLSQLLRRDYRRMRESRICEDRKSNLYNKWYDKIYDLIYAGLAKSKTYKEPPDERFDIDNSVTVVLDIIYQLDPTPNKKYFDWACRIWIDEWNKLKVVPNQWVRTQHIMDMVKAFDDYLKRGLIPHASRDIYRMKTLTRLENTVWMVSREEAKKRKNEPPLQEVVWESEDYRVTRADNWNASRILGVDTEWCVSNQESPKLWDDYRGRENVLYFIEVLQDVRFGSTPSNPQVDYNKHIIFGLSAGHPGRVRNVRGFTQGMRFAVAVDPRRAYSIQNLYDVDDSSMNILESDPSTPRNATRIARFPASVIFDIPQSVFKPWGEAQGEKPRNESTITEGKADILRKKWVGFHTEDTINAMLTLFTRRGEDPRQVFNTLAVQGPDKSREAKILYRKIVGLEDKTSELIGKEISMGAFVPYGKMHHTLFDATLKRLKRHIPRSYHKYMDFLCGDMVRRFDLHRQDREANPPINPWHMIDVIVAFDRMAHRRQIENRDINSYTGVIELELAMQGAEKRRQQKVASEQEAAAGAEIVYEDDVIKLYRIDTYEAMVKYARSSRAGGKSPWCIGFAWTREHWDDYVEWDGYQPYIVFIKKIPHYLKVYHYDVQPGDKYCLMYPPGSTYDADVWNEKNRKEIIDARNFLASISSEEAASTPRPKDYDDVLKIQRHVIKIETIENIRTGVVEISSWNQQAWEDMITGKYINVARPFAYNPNIEKELMRRFVDKRVSIDDYPTILINMGNKIYDYVRTKMPVELDEYVDENPKFGYDIGYEAIMKASQHFGWGDFVDEKPDVKFHYGSGGEE